jgi:hypothetical protein
LRSAITVRFNRNRQWRAAEPALAEQLDLIAFGKADFAQFRDQFLVARAKARYSPDPALEQPVQPDCHRPRIHFLSILRTILISKRNRPDGLSVASRRLILASGGAWRLR